MYRKFLFLILALALAWISGPFLTDLFSGLAPFAAPASGKLLDYFKNKDGEFYAEVVLWTIIFIFILPFAAFFFGFFGPHARRYSTTKLSRRIHGITAEVLILFFIFIPAAVALGLLEKSREQEESKFAYAFMAAPENAVKIMNVPEAKRAWNPDLYVYDVKLLESRSQFTNFLDALKEHGVTIPTYLYNIETNNFDRFAEQMWEVRDRANTKAIDIKYLELTQAYTNILDSRRAYLWRKEAQKHPETMDAQQSKNADYALYRFASNWKEDEIAKLSWWRKYIKQPIPYVWFQALLISIVGWLIIHTFLKSHISALQQIFMRLIEEGRFGQGGSGRFAGMFEEWGVISSYSEPGALLSMLLKPFGKQHWGQNFGKFISRERRSAEVISRQELFMGRSLYNPFLNIGLSDDRHMLTIAPSRTGKGATAIIPNLLLWEGSAIVIDPKGTNAAVTANRRREMGQKVHLVDPFGVVEKHEDLRACFNPLESLDLNSLTIREDIGVIADALVVPDPETKEKHWDDGARTILSGLIGQLVSDPEFKNASLPMLRTLLALSPEKQDELWANMYLNEGAGDAPRDAASRIIRGAGTNEISGLLSNADKHTEWLSSPSMRRTLSHSTFSFADLKKEPTTIYLILPPRELVNHNRFLRLFINMAILQMSVGGRSKIPVLMVMDEFLALGHMGEVEKALGLMAGYNFVLWPIVQDLARLKDLYKNSVNSFIANSRAVQVFGVTDPETTEYISKQLGNSASAGLPTGKSGISVPLRSPDEVAKDVERDSNRQYILRAGKAPLVLEKVSYFSGGLFDNAYPGLFHGKYEPDPDHSS